MGSMGSFDHAKQHSGASLFCVGWRYMNLLLGRAGETGLGTTLPASPERGAGYISVCLLERDRELLFNPVFSYRQVRPGQAQSNQSFGDCRTADLGRGLSSGGIYGWALDPDTGHRSWSSLQ